jgi:hypothetical protein
MLLKSQKSKLLQQTDKVEYMQRQMHGHRSSCNMDPSPLYKQIGMK